MNVHHLNIAGPFLLLAQRRQKKLQAFRVLKCHALLVVGSWTSRTAVPSSTSSPSTEGHTQICRALSSPGWKRTACSGSGCILLQLVSHRLHQSQMLALLLKLTCPIGPPSGDPTATAANDVHSQHAGLHHAVLSQDAHEAPLPSHVNCLPAQTGFDFRISWLELRSRSATRAWSLKMLGIESCPRPNPGSSSPSPL